MSRSDNKPMSLDFIEAPNLYREETHIPWGYCILFSVLGFILGMYLT